MPSNWLYIDTNFPTFTGEESTEKKITTIQNYMYMLVEQLRYSLHNLDLTNMNQTAVRQYEAYLTDPIYGRIEDGEGNINALQITAEGLAGRITDAEGNITVLTATAQSLSAQLSDAKGNITGLQATARGLTARMSTAEGNITSLTATATGLTASVSNMDGQISTLRQTVSGFRLSASSGTNSSTLTLTSNGTYISSANICFRGMVTFEDLEGSGRTTINGDNITTGKISADYILLGGELTVYRSAWEDDSVGGYMGYIASRDYYGNRTTGMGMMDASGWNQIAVTNAGARLTSRSAEVSAVVNVNLTTGNSIKMDAGRSINMDAGRSINANQEITVSSDRRLKEEIRYDVGAAYGGLFEALEPASFFYRKGLHRRHLGFIAQDVLAGLEKLGFSEEELAVLSRNEEGFYGVACGELIPILWAKVKELDKKINGAPAGTQ